MEAVVYVAPGELALAERPIPQPKEGEVLVEVAAVGICGSDLLIWGGGLARVRPPVVLGHEFSGVVADTNGCTGFADGERVVVEPLLNCGECDPCRSGNYNVCVRLGLIGIDVDGAAAPYVVVAADRLHRLPDQLSLRDAALAEPSAVALHMVRRSGVQATDTVLIVGGGPIGALVACICRAQGVQHLVVSEPNPSRRHLLDDLGFTTFDPGAQSTQELLDELTGDGFDVSFELTGVGPALTTAVELTRVHGTILLGGLPHAPVAVPIASAVMKELTLRGARVYRSDDMRDAVQLLADGAIPAARLITREVSIAEGIAGAFERLRDSRDDMKILIVPSKWAQNA